jgi:hypothetical protein
VEGLLDSLVGEQIQIPAGIKVAHQVAQHGRLTNSAAKTSLISEHEISQGAYTPYTLRFVVCIT